MKIRIDRLLVDKGLCPTRARAQSLFSTEGVAVLCDGRAVTKPGALVEDDCDISIQGQTLKYVSRGGVKLEGALESFGVDVAGLDALDLGASTGGFTDCLLQRGARSVIALDVGQGQLADKIRNDPRVTVGEKVNARNLTRENVPHDVDFIVADLSFISLKLVIPCALRFLKRGGAILVLVKPQFEAGREGIGKNGVVKSESIRRRAIDGVVSFVAGTGMEILGVTDSTIRGPEGNLEALLYARWPADRECLDIPEA